MRIRFLPDLTIWYARNAARNTLPPEIAGRDLQGACSLLGVPLWQPRRAWKRTTGSIVVEETHDSAGRTVRYRLSDGGREFVARWAIGPDGDLWQTEYPIKNTDDLLLAEVLAEQEALEPDRQAIEVVLGLAAAGGVLAIELPMRPFSRLLLELLGFGDGFFILMEAEERIAEIVARAEQSYRRAIEQIAHAVNAARSELGVPPRPALALAYSPDNLDASFLTPAHLEAYLFEGYATAAQLVRDAGLDLAVHVGGPVGSLIAALSRAGVGCLAGVCGPPQGDTPLPQAREKAGPDMVLWGGLAQDYLLASSDEKSFSDALERVLAEADEACIIGVADHVPEDASWSRICRVAERFAG